MKRSDARERSVGDRLGEQPLGSQRRFTFTRDELPTQAIRPDPANRTIDETDEDFQTLVDSVRVMGILSPLHVQAHEQGVYQLLDGERRWRAARVIGLATVPCEVWPGSASARDVTVAGVAMNEHRKQHSCLSVARRLRGIKNEHGESHEQIAHRVGIPVLRAKLYLGLFNASDALLSLFEAEDMPLKTAAELVRYEKAHGEAAARRLLRQHATSPLTARDVEILRKRRGSERRAEVHDDRPPMEPAPRRRPASFAGRIERAFETDPVGAMTELEAVAAKLGLRLVKASGRDGAGIPGIPT